MEQKNVLVVGSGAREHAIGWKLSQSPSIGKLFFWPGNAGTLALGDNVELNEPEVEQGINSLGLLFIQQQRIDLAVIGPDQPLAAGVTDELLRIGCRVFGPTKDLAKIEWSKVYAKEVMSWLRIPTAPFVVCHSTEGILHEFNQRGLPLVLKEDGLAAGKGVHIWRENVTGITWARERFAQGKGPLLVETLLPGVEASMLAFCDGERYVLCPPAFDYKRANQEGDEMTGGMGCVSPAPLISQDEWEGIGQIAVKPILDWFISENPRGFRGCLYVGLMITRSGAKVLEYNARPGDPETQTILPILDDDLLELLWQCADGKLEGRSGRLLPSTGYACCITVADKNYPAKSDAIVTLPEDLPFVEGGPYVFHANTRYDKGGNATSDGGRILSVVGVRTSDLVTARRSAYSCLTSLDLKDVRWRTDIGEEVPYLP